MRSAAECREQAEECRALAMGFGGDLRQQSLDMAKTWESLAREVDIVTCRHLSGEIREIYDGFAHEPMPEKIRDLLERLEAAEVAGSWTPGRLRQAWRRLASWN